MKIISVLIILILCISCTEKVENRHAEDTNPYPSFFEENLLKANEPILKGLKYDRIRVIVQNPYDLPSQIFNLSRIGEIYTIEKKEVFREEKNGIFKSSGFLRGNNFSSNWDSISVDINSMSTPPKEDTRTIYDGRTWIIESYVDQSYDCKEIMQNNTPEGVKSFFSLTGLTVPAIE